MKSESDHLRHVALILFVSVIVKGLPVGNEPCTDIWNTGGCSLPFIYKGEVYTNCTERDYDWPWCSTSLIYSGAWKNCTRQCPVRTLYSVNGTDQPQAVSGKEQCDFILTERGNARGAPCHFPFIYRETTYTKCTSRDHYTNWCATTSSYDRHRQWGNCLGCSARRCAKEWTSNGAACAIPFKYNGVWHNRCTTVGHGRPWCAFHTYYQHGAWGDCIDSCEPLSSCPERAEGKTGGANQCVFPFQFQGLTFVTCTKYRHSLGRFWCSTTPVYEGKWGVCKGCMKPSQATECGVRNRDVSESRVVQGWEAVPYSWPWHVAVHTSYFAGSTSYKCGGSIISPMWVLTAAHCVYYRHSSAKFYVFAGTHYKQVNQAETGVQVREVTSIHEYPGFTGLGTNPDLALLLLDSPLDFSDPKVGRVCMPEYEAVDGEDCHVTGWGSTKGELPDDVLRELKLPVLPSRICGSEAFLGNIFESFEFCAGFPDGGKDSCGGDSGGPFMCLRNQRYQQVGVVSWGIGCALERKPGVYARLHSVLPWIAKVAGDLNEDYRKELTIGGTGSGKPCYFPFKFQGVTYVACTSVQFYTMWCSITPVYQGLWGICIGFGALPNNADDATTTATTQGYTETLPDNDRIRLVDGNTPQQGRVEVSYRGEWGTVCDDFWDQKAARVACTMLGYDDGDILASGTTPGGTGKILLDNVQCRLTDSVLWDCPNIGWYVHDCEHSEDAGVVCYHPPGQEIRLVGGADSSEGRVEVKRNDRWGTVCDTSWDDDDAFVLCNTMGYTFGNASTSFPQGTGDILMSNVDCDQNMDSFWKCAHDGWDAASCTHTSDVGVKCFEFQWDKNCGMRNPPSLNMYSTSYDEGSRVVGGVETVSFSWPWQVSVQLNERHHCGGIIISPEWVISAAQCLDGARHLSEWKVIAGQHKKSYHETEPSRQIRQVIQWKLAPGFTSLGSAEDIALIRVSPSFNFSAPEVGCVLLPTRAVTPGENCYITGWGETLGTAPRDVLNEVVVPVIDTATCNQAEWYNGLVTQFEFCAGFQLGQKDSCVGDSGGPLSCLRNQRFELAGIASWGYGCGQQKKPGVYTEVFSVLQWIEQETGLRPST